MLTIAGDRDAAVDVLQDLLARPYANAITVPLLRADPVWDPLREHARFQQLVRD